MYKWEKVIFVFLHHRLSKRNEELLSQENNQLNEELNMKREDCDGLNRKLDLKVTRPPLTWFLMFLL